MGITEEMIDDLTAEIEDLIEPSEQRDELWRNIIAPLTFEALEYFENDLTVEDRNFIGLLRHCYNGESIDSARLNGIRTDIEEYKFKIEETDFYNMFHRYLLSTMLLLAYYPMTQEDWDNGILWLNVSGWIQFGIPLEWIYDKLQNVKVFINN